MVELRLPQLGTLPAVAVAYFVASRLAYVIGIGAALTLQKRRQAFTRSAGVEVGYRRFRRLAAFLMNNDALSFGLMTVLTRDTLPFAIPLPWRIGIGAGCIAVGAAVKLWARAALGSSGYHWRDFFEEHPTAPVRPLGPYRYLKNPMYTVGYLHAYGIAVLLASLPALVLAAFAQVSILVFYQVVERPHFRRLPAGG